MNKDPKGVHASMAVIWGGECVKAAVFQPLVRDGSLILEAVYNIDKRHHVCGEKRGTPTQHRSSIQDT